VDFYHCSLAECIIRLRYVLPITQLRQSDYTIIDKVVILSNFVQMFDWARSSAQLDSCSYHLLCSADPARHISRSKTSCNSPWHFITWILAKFFVSCQHEGIRSKSNVAALFLFCTPIMITCHFIHFRNVLSVTAYSSILNPSTLVSVRLKKITQSTLHSVTK
jgi:hypothetical protein